MTATTTRIFLRAVSNRIICKELQGFRKFVRIGHFVADGPWFSLGLVKQKGGKHFENNGCQVGPISLLGLSGKVRNGKLSLSSLIERLEVLQHKEEINIMTEPKRCLSDSEGPENEIENQTKENVPNSKSAPSRRGRVFLRFKRSKKTKIHETKEQEVRPEGINMKQKRESGCFPKFRKMGDRKNVQSEQETETGVTPARVLSEKVKLGVCEDGVSNENIGLLNAGEICCGSSKDHAKMYALKNALKHASALENAYTKEDFNDGIKLGEELKCEDSLGVFNEGVCSPSSDKKEQMLATVNRTAAIISSQHRNENVMNEDVMHSEKLEDILCPNEDILENEVLVKESAEVEKTDELEEFVEIRKNDDVIEEKGVGVSGKRNKDGNYNDCRESYEMKQQQEKDIKEGVLQNEDYEIKEFDDAKKVGEIKEQEDIHIQEERAAKIEIKEDIDESRESKDIVMKKEEIDDVEAMDELREKEEIKDLGDNKQKKEKLNCDDDFCLGSLFDTQSYGYQEVERRLQTNKKLGSAKRRKRKGKFNKGIDQDQANEVDIRGGEEGMKRRKRGAKVGGARLQKSGENEGSDEAKEKRLLPNYFLAIRIDDPSIHKEVKKCQDSIVEQEKLFKHVLIAVPTLHITLLVMRINDDDDMTNAKTALQECKCELQNLYKDCSQQLVFTGLGHFRNKVVFLDMEKQSQEPLLVCLESMVSLLRESYNAKGITLSKDSNDDFKPHATIMKMSKNIRKMKKKGIRKIDNKYFKDFAEYEFGTQRFCEILLCSMLDKKNDDGFYNVVDRLDLKVLPDEDKDV